MNNMKKILSDCDGVLLDWGYSFEKWMKFHFGMTVVNREAYNIADRYDSNCEFLDKNHLFYLPRVFCNSSRIGNLRPHRDAVKYVKKLWEEHGMTIDVVTSLSLDPESQKLRERNLRTVFGQAIDRIICLDTGEDKDEALAEWKDSGNWWIEDKPENAQAGLDAGLNPILIDAEYNQEFSIMDNPGIARLDNWKQIYEFVTHREFS